jgi:cysteine desulfurase
MTTTRRTSQRRALQEEPIYLDYNATTPVDPRVVAALLPYLTTHFGNPSSTHRYGEEPAAGLTKARDQVAELINGTADEIVFTGSGSETDILAVRGAVLAQNAASAHIITQRTEHPAVLAACQSLHRLHGVDVTYLPVDSTGLVDPKDLVAAITPRTVLVSIMYANNETGTIQPIAELADVAHNHGVLFHTDAAQAVSKAPIDVRELGVDLLTIVGHKMYAPKGIAALYVRSGINLEPSIYGGSQEHGRRAGTENVALAAGLGAAAEVAAAELAADEPQRLKALRDGLHQQLADRLPGRVWLNGHPTDRLPNTVNLSISGTRGDDLLAAVTDIAAATGSACHSGSAQNSPVLTAMGFDDDRARSSIRLSVGRWTTADDVEYAAAELAVASQATTAKVSDPTSTTTTQASPERR